MGRALIFLIKISLMAALAVWVADRPGTVQIDWLSYHLKMNLGLFLLSILAFTLLSIFIYNILRTFITLPASLKRYKQIKYREKGYKSLTLGLSAVAAGERRDALKFARQTGKYLPGDTGLPLLLKAQAERLDGREDDARKSFALMLENKDAAFLGLRGLLQAALDRGEYIKALNLARTALDSHPKQRWILKTVYELEIRALDWEAARSTLKKLKKAKALPRARAKYDEAALLIAEGEAQREAGFVVKALQNLKAAHKTAPDFVPAALKLAQQYRRENNRRAAVRVIEKTWKLNPHPILTQLWEDLITPSKKNNKTARLKWFEKLITMNPESTEGYIANARETLAQQLWGKTREHLNRAAEIRPSKEIFKLKTELEKRSGAPSEEVQHAMQKTESAPPDKAWICRETGQIYPAWHWAPEGMFNTLEWRTPQNEAHKILQEENKMPRGILEAL